MQSVEAQPGSCFTCLCCACGAVWHALPLPHLDMLNPTCAQVPLILGIWGGKGQGKTFQCNLAYKKLGIAPIVMSAGELESGNAGEPAKLIRQRYREASDIIKKGKMASLFINDLDAGAGRMGDATQVRCV